MNLNKYASPKLYKEVNKSFLGRIPLHQKVIGIGLILSFTLPIFRSGERSKLTFWQWVIAHTAWGPPVLHIPEEDYSAAFRKTKSTGEDTEEQGLGNHPGTGIIITTKGGRGYNEN